MPSRLPGDCGGGVLTAVMRNRPGLWCERTADLDADRAPPEREAPVQGAGPIRPTRHRSEGSPVTSGGAGRRTAPGAAHPVTDHPRPRPTHGRPPPAPAGETGVTGSPGGPRQRGPGRSAPEGEDPVGRMLREAGIGPEAAAAGGRHAARPDDIPGRGWLDILRRVRRALARDHLWLAAAGVAYCFLVAAIPGLVVLVGLLGLLVAGVLHLGAGLGGALVAALWGARTGVATLVGALNLAYREREARGFLRYQLATAVARPRRRACSACWRWPWSR